VNLKAKKNARLKALIKSWLEENERGRDDDSLHSAYMLGQARAIISTFAADVLEEIRQEKRNGR
jgi:hypothetical protein